VGEANYRWGYYRQRASDRNLDNPHSIVFKVVSEEGAIGLILALLFVVGVIGALVASWRKLPPAARRSAGALAAAGAVVLGQSLVDWIYLIPGVLGLGFFCLGLAVAATGQTSGAAEARTMPVWSRIVLGVALCAAALAVLPLYISESYVDKARAEETAGKAASRLSAARTASDFNPLSPTPLYLEASSLETLGQQPAARQKLLDALELDPRNFATLGLLGDFEARSGHRAAARRYYKAASLLNPRDVGLQALARRGR
jgi:tetratricopeptide (TPR) repeat protein